MKCNEVQSRLDALLDERKHPAEDGLLKEHLADCHACRHLVDSYSTMLAGVRQWALGETPRTFGETPRALGDTPRTLGEAKKLVETHNELAVKVGRLGQSVVHDDSDALVDADTLIRARPSVVSTRRVVWASLAAAVVLLIGIAPWLISQRPLESRTTPRQTANVTRESPSDHRGSEEVTDPQQITGLARLFLVDFNRMMRERPTSQKKPDRRVAEVFWRLAQVGADAAPSTETGPAVTGASLLGQVTGGLEPLGESTSQAFDYLLGPISDVDDSRS